MFLLSSCNKVKQHSRKLDGTWTIYSYCQIQGGGFKEYYPAEGTITFVSNDDGSFTYEENYAVYTPTDTIIYNRKGSGMLVGKRATDFEMTFTDPVSYAITDGSISVITKDDLKFQFRDNTSAHQFVFQKP